VASSEGHWSAAALERLKASLEDADGSDIVPVADARESPRPEETAGESAWL
jgi:hypothetical protein